MLLARIQRLSIAACSAYRRFAARCAAWVRGNPFVSAWVYAPTVARSKAEIYEQFNGWYFSNLHEQERMLGDNVRMDFYHAAISRHVKPGDRVIDLGTGTGILAAFAARRGAAQVYAIDHSDIIDHARALVAANGIDTITFFDGHSSNFKLDERVDVILHEQMGDFLFDEAMVPNVCDLRDRLLKPGGRILPSCFHLYCEPIQIRDDRLVPFIWELNVHGFDYSSMEKSRPQEADYYRLASCDLGFVQHYLSTPEPALSVDLHTLTEITLPKQLIITRRITTAGRLDGLAVYFSAHVDDDLSLSSAPLDSGRAPHWGYRILRMLQEDWAVGDVIEVTLEIGAWTEPDTWHWRHRKVELVEEVVLA
jgi:type I protein arginine methyltransferase